MRWNGRTVCIIASGPSLTPDDAVYATRNQDVRSIVINESWRLAPTADVLYGADCEWWKRRGPNAGQFTGERWTQQRGWPHPGPLAPLQVVTSLQDYGLSPPGADRVYTGYNSGYQALGLAVIWGAARIVLLGFDMQGKPGAFHWHGDHSAPLQNPVTAMSKMRKAFSYAATAAPQYGVEIVNASRATALTCFPCVPLEDAL